MPQKYLWKDYSKVTVEQLHCIERGVYHIATDRDYLAPLQWGSLEYIFSSWPDQRNGLHNAEWLCFLCFDTSTQDGASQAITSMLQKWVVTQYVWDKRPRPVLARSIPEWSLDDIDLGHRTCWNSMADPETALSNMAVDIEIGSIKFHPMYV